MRWNGCYGNKIAGRQIYNIYTYYLSSASQCLRTSRAQIIVDIFVNYHLSSILPLLLITPWCVLPLFPSFIKFFHFHSLFVYGSKKSADISQSVTEYIICETITKKEPNINTEKFRLSVVSATTLLEDRTNQVAGRGNYSTLQ